jgi:threonine dehydrogenase-like Zn-dependent dehydrogenase
VRHVPDGLDLAVAALVEPVAVCLEAVRRARVAEGERVLVVGDGPFGIMIARLTLRRRPERLVLVGRHDFRLRQVPEAVAINERTAADAAAAVAEATGGVDAAILAVASAAGAVVPAVAARLRPLVIFSGLLNRRRSISSACT